MSSFLLLFIPSSFLHLQHLQVSGSTFCSPCQPRGLPDLCHIIVHLDMDSPVIISLMLQVGGAAPPPSLEPLPKRQRPSALQGSRVPRASDCLHPNCTFFKAHGGSLFLLDQAGRLRCVTPVKSCMDRLELAASMAHERGTRLSEKQELVRLPVLLYSHFCLNVPRCSCPCPALLASLPTHECQIRMLLRQLG